MLTTLVLFVSVAIMFLSAADETDAEIVKRQSCSSSMVDTCNRIFAEIDVPEPATDPSGFVRLQDKQLDIICRDPCFSAYSTFYNCTGDEETIGAVIDFLCLQYEDEYCFTSLRLNTANGNIDDSFDSFDSCTNPNLSKNLLCYCGNEYMHAKYVGMGV